ncbi:MAG: DUF2090 domain-containing protein [Betaproteobacteria bacterium]
MNSGYTKPLYLLPFDHRASFESGMFGWSGTHSDTQSARITAAKRVIYDGFVAAVAGRVAPEKTGILVDERFGADILRDAKRSGVITCAPAEMSGQDEFDFEFGEDFARHIEAFAPTFCKVLVRYNPDGDHAVNGRQAARLRRLSEYLSGSLTKYMVELLIPVTPRQLEALGGDTRACDRECRPALMARAIRELQDAGIEPDVWKVEGFDHRDDCERITVAAQRGGRGNIGCIVLGGGENEQHVQSWLTTAAAVPGFIGFAVGRTTFWDPLIAFRDGTITREAAVAEVSRRYCQSVDIFETARSATMEEDHPAASVSADSIPLSDGLDRSAQ